MSQLLAKLSPSLFLFRRVSISAGMILRRHDTVYTTGVLRFLPLCVCWERHQVPGELVLDDRDPDVCGIRRHIGRHRPREDVRPRDHGKPRSKYVRATYFRHQACFVPLHLLA